MEKVIVAFAGVQNGRRVRDMLERAGVASCLLCTSADQVKRTVHEQQVSAIVCGYKFADGPAELLYEDLPSYCRMLMVASQSLLDLVQNPEILRLSAPASRSDLISAVEELLAQIEAQPLHFGKAHITPPVSRNKQAAVPPRTAASRPSCLLLGYSAYRCASTICAAWASLTPAVMLFF